MSLSFLIVEQYSDLRTVIGSALSRGSNDVDVVNGSGEAIRMLREHSYSAILLSPTLPIREDPVIHFLAEHQPESLSRVVLMTEEEGDPPEPAMDALRENGCRVLLKPFGERELFASLELEVPSHGTR